MNFEKVLQYALPAAAGLGAAFDPYRNVSRGLNQAVSMRTMLKGEEEQRASRESAEQRAEADQKMQEQRHAWAEKQFQWNQEQYRDIREDKAAFESFKGDLKASSPKELWPSIDAASSMGDLRTIRGQREERRQGEKIASALSSYDQSIPPQLLEIVKSNPGWGYAMYQNIIQGRNDSAADKRLMQFREILPGLKEAVDSGRTDMATAAGVIQNYVAQIPGAQFPDWITKEGIQQAEFQAQQEELAPIKAARDQATQEYLNVAQPIKEAFEAQYENTNWLKQDLQVKQRELAEAQDMLDKLYQKFNLPRYNSDLAYHYGEPVQPLKLEPIPGYGESAQKPQAGGREQAAKDLERGRETNTAARGRVPKGGDILDQYLTLVEE